MDDKNINKTLTEYNLLGLDKFEKDTKDKYYGRYHKVFNVKDEDKLIEFIKNVFYKLNKKI